MEWFALFFGLKVPSQSGRYFTDPPAPSNSLKKVPIWGASERETFAAFIIYPRNRGRKKESEEDWLFWDKNVIIFLYLGWLLSSYYLAF